MTFEMQELSTVLNIDSGNFVLLPLDNEQVIKQGAAQYNVDYDLITIDGESYDKLKADLDLTEHDAPTFKDFYIGFCGNVAGYGVPIMSDYAYGVIYDDFLEQDLTAKQIFEGMPDNMWHWREDSVCQYLDNDDISYNDRSDEELAQLAIEIMHNKDYEELHSSYKADRQDVILYKTTKSADD